MSPLKSEADYYKTILNRANTCSIQINKETSLIMI